MNEHAQTTIPRAKRILNFLRGRVRTYTKSRPLYCANSGNVTVELYQGSKPAGRPGLYTEFHGFPGYYVACRCLGADGGRAEPCPAHEIPPQEYGNWQRAMDGCFFYLRDTASRNTATKTQDQDTRSEPAPKIDAFNRGMTPQECQLELIRHAVGDRFDGSRVAADLLRHRGLWRGALMDSPVLNLQSAGVVIDLIKLRDIEDGVWNADTLYILSSGKNDRKLLDLARRWRADELGWLSPELAAQRLGQSPTSARVLFLWWD